MTNETLVKIILIALLWMAVDIRMAIRRIVTLLEARERRDVEARR